MSLFENLLSEQQQLLVENGYDEQGLNSPDKPGRLFKELRSNLSLAIRNSLHEKGPQTFEIKTVGWFNDDKDYVHFTMHYRFDAGEGSLSLFRLDMGYNNRSRTIHLDETTKIPHSSQAISIFQRPRTLMRPQKRPPPPSNAPPMRKPGS